jgi:hypothetical protein
VFKTSNICNLACRSCAGWDSNTYTKEGQHYAELYHTQTDGKVWNRFIPLLPPKHMDFMQYKDIAGNLEKIDFFGGEPFLNITQLTLLEHLIEQGLSKKITLFYSTNCTNYPTERLQKAWNSFKRVEISVSIDGTGDQFEYMRWPGKWNEAEQVLDHILSLKTTLDCDLYVMSSLTCSLLNVWYVDDLFDWLQSRIGNVYINMVNSPTYLTLHIAPDHVKLALRQKIKNPELQSAIFNGARQGVYSTVTQQDIAKNMAAGALAGAIATNVQGKYKDPALANAVGEFVQAKIAGRNNFEAMAAALSGYATEEEKANARKVITEEVSSLPPEQFQALGYKTQDEVAGLSSGEVEGIEDLGSDSPFA